MSSIGAGLLRYSFSPVLLVVFCSVLLLTACLVYLALHGPDRRMDWFLAVVLLAAPCHSAALIAARSISSLCPWKLDLYVYQIDGWLGFEPAFALGQALRNHALPIAVLALAYHLLPIAILVLFGASLWFGGRSALGMLPVFALNLALSVPFYLLAPVCGPSYAFPGFPSTPAGPVVPVPVRLDAPPNGVPSIHFSSALLIFWYARWLPLGRWIGGAYLLLTAAATMGLGEHYLFDLAAAVPYAVLVYKLPGWTRAAYARATPRMVAAISRTVSSSLRRTRLGNQNAS